MHFWLKADRALGLARLRHNFLTYRRLPLPCNKGAADLGASQVASGTCELAMAGLGWLARHSLRAGGSILVPGALPRLHLGAVLGNWFPGAVFVIFYNCCAVDRAAVSDSATAPGAWTEEDEQSEDA